METDRREWSKADQLEQKVIPRLGSYAGTAQKFFAMVHKHSPQDWHVVMDSTTESPRPFLGFNPAHEQELAKPWLQQRAYGASKETPQSSGAL